jgi:hypothetical protein
VDHDIDQMAFSLPLGGPGGGLSTQTLSVKSANMYLNFVRGDSMFFLSPGLFQSKGFPAAEKRCDYCSRALMQSRGFPRRTSFETRSDFAG